MRDGMAKHMEHQLAATKAAQQPPQPLAAAPCSKERRGEDVAAGNDSQEARRLVLRLKPVTPSAANTRTQQEPTRTTQEQTQDKRLKALMPTTTTTPLINGPPATNPRTRSAKRTRALEETPPRNAREAPDAPAQPEEPLAPQALSAEAIQRLISRWSTGTRITVTWAQAIGLPQEVWHGTIAAKERMSDGTSVLVRYDNTQQHSLPPEHDITIYSIERVTTKAIKAAKQKDAPKMYCPPREAGKNYVAWETFVSALRSTRATLPFHLWMAWAGVVKQALVNIRLALRGDDINAKDKALIDFLLLPSDYVPNRKIRHLEHSLKHQQPASASSQTLRKELSDDDRAVLRAMDLAEQGLLSRASKALIPAKIADLADDRAAVKAREKFPAPHAQLKHCIKARVIAPFAADDVHLFLHQLGNGASGGLTGWTKELLMAAVRTDQSIASDLGILCAEILNETFSPEAQEICRMHKFVALEKDAVDYDVRPICPGDALQKLIGALCFHLDAPKLAPWQVGIGMPNAAATVLDEVTTHIREGKFIATIDAKNAFNAVSRSTIEEILASTDNMPFLAQYFRYAYYHPSRMVSQTSKGTFTVSACEGTMQGDLPSGFLFCKAVESAIEISTKSIAWKKAYYDDLTLADGSVSNVVMAFKSLVSTFKAVGIDINHQKCELWCPRPLSADELEAVRELQVKVVDREGAFKLLGAPCGVNVDAMRSIVEKKMESHNAYFERLKNPKMDARLAYTLLRVCGTPRFNYLCQMVDPKVMYPFYQRFDDCITATFATIVGTEPNRATIFTASGAGLSRFILHGPYLFTKTQALIHRKRLDTQPPNEQEFSTSNPFEESHVRSACGNHASTWMQYAEVQCGINSEDFVYAMQLRCQFFQRKYKTCTCSFKFSSASDIECLGHLLTCSENTYGYLQRHDEILAELKTVLRNFAFAMQAEPRQFSGPNDDQRPDLLVFSPWNSSVIDVSVVTNIAKSHAHLGSPADGAASDKVTKHRINVESKGDYTFFPVIFESSGLVHGDFDAWVAFLQRQVILGSRKQFRRAMCFAASVALQRGNARIIKHAYARLEAANRFGSRSNY